MNLENNLNGYTKYISMWNIFFGKHILCKSEVKQDSFCGPDDSHVLCRFPNSFFDSNLSCFYVLIFIMTDKSDMKSLHFNISSKPEVVSNCSNKNACVNRKVRPNQTYFDTKVKNNHHRHHHHIENRSDPSEPYKQDLSEDIEPSCHNKTDSGPSTWQRRDSFSSCSSDSAVYCSSRHTQIDSTAQDVIRNTPCEKTNGKKRHRHSSGSSALSSASDSSNKDGNVSHVNDILSCLERNATGIEQSFSESNECVTSKSSVQTRSSISHYPTTVTSEAEIATFVEEETLSYTCKSPPTSERFHNLRRQIRKKTCHNCDCSGSHTTVVLRRFTQIKHATTTNHGLPKVKKLRQVIPPRQNHVPPKLLNHVKQCDKTDASEIPSTPSQKERSNKKRRTEVDKLYDALHEIHWAKHISPDNILSQIDFRRAATLSFYSSKNKTESSSPTPVQKFKSPQCPKKNHLARNVSGRKKFAAPCSCSASCENISEASGSTKQSSNSCRAHQDVQEKWNSDTRQDAPVQLHTGTNEKDSDLSSSDPDKSRTSESSSSGNINSIHNVTEIHSSSSLSNNESELGAEFAEKPTLEVDGSSKDDVSLEDIDVAVEEQTVEVICEVPSVLVNDDGESFALVSESDDHQLWDILPNSDLVVYSETENPIDENPPDIHHIVRIETLNVLPQGDEIIFEDMYPDIVDVETSDVCHEEVITRQQFDAVDSVISSTLPVLTKIEPASEHSSEDSPPHLEPCAFPECAISPSKSEIAEPGEVLKCPELTKEDVTNTSELECKKETFSVDAPCESLNLKVLETENRPNLNPPKKLVKKRRTISKPNVIRRNLLKKYFTKSKIRLKHFENCTSASESVPKAEKQEPCEETNSKVFTSCGASQTNPAPMSIGEEERNNIIKNDSLRVHLHDLNQIGRHNHYFKCDQVAHTSYTCTTVQTSELKSTTKRCMEITKQELQYKSLYEDKKDVKPVPVKKSKALPLDYKKDAGHIPFHFTVHYKFITVNKNNGYTQVILKLTEGQNTYLSAKALNELRDTLNSASTDSECQVLIINSIGRSFCLGLDLKPLLGSQKCAAAKEIAFAVKDFIEALAAFNKPLVVVVNGAAVGLGVTLLAYSDIIISSESATFHMPYSRLGFCPEGGATLMLPFVVGSTVAMDMLIRGRTLSAYEAHGYGLVSEVLSSSRLPLRLVERVRQLAESPSLAMESTKSMLRMHLYQRLSGALESETAMLPKQWLSEPCQSALRKIFNKSP